MPHLDVVDLCLEGWIGHAGSFAAAEIRYFAIRNFYKTIDLTAMGDEGLCDVNRLD